MSTHIVTEAATWPFGSVDPNDYQLRTEKGEPDGYAPLDEDGLVPGENLPAGSGGGTGAVNSVNGEDGDVVLTAVDVGAIDLEAEGIALGVATLDSSGQVPASQLGNVPEGGGTTIADQIVADPDVPNGTSDNTAYLAGLLAVAIARRAQLRIPPATGGVWRISELTLPSNADVDATGATFKLFNDVAKRFLVNTSLKLGSPGTVRDTNIRWRGGKFDRAQVGGHAGLTLDGMNIMFGFVDGLKFIATEHLQSHATDGGLYGLYLYNVTDVLIDDWKGTSTAITCGTLQIFSGSNVTFRNIRGTFGDDVIALVPGNVTSLKFASFPDATLTNIRVENIIASTVYTGVKLMCGTLNGIGTTVYRVADVEVKNVKVDAYQAVFVGAALGYPGLSGGTIENATFDTIRNTRNTRPGVAIGEVCTIRGLTLRNITTAETTASIGLPVSIDNISLLEDVLIEDTAWAPGTQSVYLVNVAATATVGQLRLSNIRIKAGSGTQNTGPLKTIAGASIGSIAMDNISVEGGGWVAGEHATSSVLYLRAVAARGGSVQGYLRVMTGAALDVRDASMNAATSIDDFIIPPANTGTVTARAIGFRTNVAKLQLAAGGLAHNTNAGLGCGTGPVVCDGTVWKSLATGATT